MFTFAKNSWERFRSDGLAKTARITRYRLEDAYRLWRFGIRSEMQEAFVNRTQRELGLTNREANSHNPTPSYCLFRAAMRQYVHPTREDVFLDFGSGTGRAMLMAATYPFKKVIGVEYSEELCAIASRVVGRAGRKLPCQDIQLVTQDASVFPIPPDVTVIYFYNPFVGATLAKVCENIRQSLVTFPRKLTIVYLTPAAFDEIVNGCGWLEKCGEVRLPAISKRPMAIYESVCERRSH